MHRISSTVAVVMALAVPGLASAPAAHAAASAPVAEAQVAQASGEQGQRSAGAHAAPVVQSGGVDVSTQPPNATNPLYPVRGQRLMGQKLYGKDGDEIGEVKDVIMDRENQVTAAVVDVGTFLGLDTREVTVPIKDIRLGDGQRLTTDITAEQAKALPTEQGTANQSAKGAKGTGTGETR